MSYEYPFKDATDELKLMVWLKADPVEGKITLEWRKDVCGKEIKYEDHANTDSEYGWEIDHIHPLEKGGHDDMDNLQALNWKTHRAKGDNHPWDCSMA